MASHGLLCDAAKASNSGHATDERVFVSPPPQTAGRAQASMEKIMKTTNLIAAAVFAMATTTVFAETTATQTPVNTYQTAGVAQVYGRASAPNVKLASPAADQDAAGRDTKIAVTAHKDVIEFGRS
jgi:hypothetical protein